MCRQNGREGETSTIRGGTNIFPFSIVLSSILFFFFISNGFKHPSNYLWR